MEQNEILDHSSSLQLAAHSKPKIKGIGSWSMFFGVLSFIGAAFAVLGGIMVLGMGGFAAMEGAPFPSWLLPAAGVLYLLFGGVYIFFGLRFLKINKASKLVAEHDSNSGLDQFISALHDIFKWGGIITVAMIVLYILAIIAMLGAGGMAAMQNTY